MGVCCSCCVAQKLEPTVPTLLLPAPSTEQMQDPLADPDADHDSSTIHRYLNDGETAFLKTNVTGNSFFNMVSANFTSWISQASGAIKAIWDNVDEDNEEEETTLDADTSSKLIIFSLAELKAATFGFRQDMLLGIGGFGRVYKGTQKKLTIRGTRKKFFAVKQLDFNSKQGYRQWQTEVKFLRKLSHPNIIKLLGYCQDDDDEELLIVYEFMPKGSLNYHLFGKRAGRSLPWDIRVKVVIGMARGLCYLHMMERPIIFRDFKSSNILLDESCNAKISDFGLAKWGPAPGNSCIKGHVMGTEGYADPEYVATGNLYVKSDVYGFGVVLAEILTGLRAVDKKRPTEKRILADWVKPYLSNKYQLKQIMDSRLEGKYAPKEAIIVAQLAFRCLNQTPEIRPSMKEVVDSLEQLQARYQ